MKPSDIRYKMKVIVTAGYYEHCVGTVWEYDCLKQEATVFLTGKGKRRFFRKVFRGFTKEFPVSCLEPL